MVFSQPLWLLAILLLPVTWLLLRRRAKMGHPNLANVPSRAGVGLLALLPKLLLSGAFLALCLGLARPQRVFFEADGTAQARDIIIAVDKSGSMSAPLDGYVPKSVVGDTELDREFLEKIGKSTKDTAASQPVRIPDGDEDEVPKDRVTRIKVAKLAVLDFVRNRYLAKGGDRIGFMLFDIYQYWSWPLTHDLKMIYRMIQFADRGVGSGTNFGDIEPGPIDAAAAHFDELGKSSTRVVILVTDGEDRLSSDTRSRLEDIIEEKQIRFYVIGVGDRLANSDTPIIQFAQEVGGQVFRVEKAGDLTRVFKQIDALERSAIVAREIEKRQELFFPFVAVAVTLLILGLFTEALVLNQ
jgi:Ca-activated chloride channel family protein